MRDRPDRVSYAVATTNDLAARILSSSATQQSFAIADQLAASPNSIRWKRDITIKRRLFERSGAREYWLVDPDHRLVRVFRRDAAGASGWAARSCRNKPSAF